MKHFTVKTDVFAGAIHTKTACGIAEQHPGPLPEDDGARVDCPTCAVAVVCACGGHEYRWTERRWYRLTPEGPKPVDARPAAVATCMRGRGPEAFAKHVLVQIDASPGIVRTTTACGLVKEHVSSLPKEAPNDRPIDCPTCAEAYEKRPRVGGK